MNNTTLNMTTLDGGNVIIKKGEGGGTTINNQDKIVDITENGTTEVVADGGFTGLGKVTINTEVSGGGNLSPDAIIVEPNGWYWGFSDEYVNSENFTHEMVNQALGMLVNFLGTRICNSLTYWPMNGAMFRQGDLRSYLNLSAEAHPDYYIRYVAESKNSSPLLGENKGVKYDCWRDVFLASGEVTNEDEFIQLMSSQFGLVRLSKDEYEALWNSAE